MKPWIRVSAIIGGLIAMGVIIAIIVFRVLPLSPETKPETSSVTTPTASPPVTTNTVIPTSSISANPSTPKPTQSSSTFANVNFELYVSSVNISGITSATITSQLSNNGTSDAHNAWAKVEAYQQGTRLQINGQDFFRQDLGTIKAASTTEVRVTLSFNPLDALKVLQNGATFSLSLISDEKTQNMSYDYHP
jgi:hypothetical protein